MEARKLADTKVAPIQLSIRVRPPSIDPQEISAALDLEPEHFFKAGQARKPRAKGQIAGRHTQSYWLAPVTAKTWSEQLEPGFLAAIAAQLSIPCLILYPLLNPQRLRTALPD